MREKLRRSSISWPAARSSAEAKCPSRSKCAPSSWFTLVCSKFCRANTESKAGLRVPFMPFSLPEEEEEEEEDRATPLYCDAQAMWSTRARETRRQRSSCWRASVAFALSPRRLCRMSSRRAETSPALCFPAFSIHQKQIEGGRQNSTRHVMC